MYFFNLENEFPRFLYLRSPMIGVKYTRLISEFQSNIEHDFGTIVKERTFLLLKWYRLQH
jgi:hypothetical protein